MRLFVHSHEGSQLSKTASARARTRGQMSAVGYFSHRAKKETVTTSLNRCYFGNLCCLWMVNLDFKNTSKEILAEQYSF